MNKKKIISLLMILVLILSMSPASSVSARVNSGSFSFVAFPNRPSASFTVTCRAWLNGTKMTGTFSYSYPSTPHYLQEYTTKMIFDAYDGNSGMYLYGAFPNRDSATMNLDFNPEFTNYKYEFDGITKGILNL